MARTSVPVTAMALGVGLALPAGVAADQPNGHTVPAAGKTQRLLLIARNTAGSAKNVTILKGADQTLAIRAGVGDLVVAVTNAQERWFVVESARCAQADGSLSIDLESGFTGTIAAVRLPVA